MSRLGKHWFPILLFGIGIPTGLLYIHTVSRCDAYFYSAEYQVPSKLVKWDFATYCYVRHRDQIRFGLQ